MKKVEFDDTLSIYASERTNCHYIPTAPGDTACGSSFFDGCYERYASTTGLVHMSMAYDPSLDNGRKIFARLDDPEVRTILDRWVDEIMLGLSSLTHIFNPACIVLGGGIMVQPLIMELIRSKISRFIMPSFANVDIRPAECGNSAGLLGACHLAAKYMQEKG